MQAHHAGPRDFCVAHRTRRKKLAACAVVFVSDTRCPPARLVHAANKLLGLHAAKRQPTRPRGLKVEDPVELRAVALARVGWCRPSPPQSRAGAEAAASRTTGARWARMRTRSRIIAVVLHRSTVPRPPTSDSSTRSCCEPASACSCFRLHHLSSSFFWGYIAPF